MAIDGCCRLSIANKMRSMDGFLKWEDLETDELLGQCTDDDTTMTIFDPDSSET
jgi:hypothetical protein